jgi:hypothetical protein
MELVTIRGVVSKTSLIAPLIAFRKVCSSPELMAGQEQVATCLKYTPSQP